MKKIISTLFFLVALTTLSFGQGEKEYRDALTTMFEVSGSEETFQAAISQMVDLFKQQYSEVDKKTWNELEKEFKKTSIEDLVELLIPVYQKYLTLDDLKDLITFYKTPVGQKYAEKTPLIMQESMIIGQQWGIKIGEEFTRKMQEKGY